MRHIFKNILLSALLVAGYGCTSCENTPKEIPNWREFDPEEEGGTGEEGGGSTPTAKGNFPSDMVLLYGGGHHRSPYRWTSDILKDYVIYTDRSGKKHWLFDGFLMLEFKDSGSGGAGRTFVTGYAENGKALPSALKEDWEKLASYYFESNGGVAALDEAIGLAATDMGAAPDSLRKVMIGMPEPIAYELYSDTGSSTTYWGELDGKQLDFSKTADRLEACKWYVDKVMGLFEKGGYKYVELAGFYWVAEKATNTRSLMPEVASYLDGKGMSFSWIPFYSADGWADWASFGFDCAYLQPNYFFTESVPYSRLDDACTKALEKGMGMEMEFDGNAMASNGRGYRLQNYMQAFKKYGVWESLPLAYYQGSWALRWLKRSSREEDNELYHDFCDFVVSRPYREGGSDGK